MLDLNRESERELIESSKIDINAFGSIFEKYYDQIFNYTLRRTANVEDARDITAETFYKALRNIRRFKWKQAPFSAWLYTIAGNEIAAFYRKGRYKLTSMEHMQSQGFDPESQYDLEEEVIAAENALQKQEDLLICSRAINELPRKYQEVLALRYFTEKKIDEISVIVGKPEGTVKSLLHRGLKKLKKMIVRDRKNATFLD